MNCEMQGVSYIRLAISKTDYLVPHINDNDREPSWDGDVEVYHKAGGVHAKSDLILKVPVQVKGHKANNLKKQSIKYPVEYADMENFLHMGGTVFFVVYVDEEGEQHRIYYAEFLPYNLKRILRKRAGRTSKNIEMKTFPTKKNDISDLFLGFTRNMKKQRAEIYSDEVSLEALIKGGTVPELSFGFSLVPNEKMLPFDYLLRGNLYLYAKLPYGVEKVVKHITTIEMTGTTIHADIIANGKKFYDEYQVFYKKDVIELCFGKSTKYIINRSDNKKLKFTFMLQGNLSERITDEEFIIEALTARQFEVDGTVYPLNAVKPEELASFNLSQRKEHLEWLRTVKLTLDALDVTEELDCEKLTQKDEENLQVLKMAIIDKQPIPVTDTGYIMGFYNVGNLKILICTIKDRENDSLFRVCSFNDCPLEVKAYKGDSAEYPSSHYVLLKQDAFLKSSNINYEKMIASLKSIPFSEIYAERIVLLLLEMLKAYDESNGKRKDILATAIDVAKWMKENDPFSQKEILVLNYLQSLKRQRTLQKDEVSDLIRIVERKDVSEEIYTAAYLLLDNHNAAEIHYKLMDTETQNIFKEYPIFRFWVNNNKEAKS